MTIPNSFELANDSEFRLLANFTTPPRAGRITGIEPSGQVRVATDDPDGGDVLAWPLNGFHYAVDDVVYIAFAANSPDTAIVIGAKAPLPILDAGSLPEAYVPLDGSDPLTGDWDIGEERRIKAEAIRARDMQGLRLEDDAGNLGVFVEDVTGDVGIQTASPTDALDVAGGIRVTANVAFDAELPGRLYKSSGNGFSFVGVTGTVYDLAYSTPAGVGLFANPTGTANIVFNPSQGFAGYGVTEPQGKLHVHDGTGGMIFVTKTGITNVAQTILPNGNGDVTRQLTGFYIANHDSRTMTNILMMQPGETFDIVIDSYTMRLTLAADGSLTVKRQSGTGTATLVLLGVWL